MKGFAVTLCIGIITTVFTAVFATRIYYDWRLSRRQLCARQRLRRGALSERGFGAERDLGTYAKLPVFLQCGFHGSHREAKFPRGSLVDPRERPHGTQTIPSRSDVGHG